MSNLVYLISSLPSLSFGQHPPISIENFYSDAKEQLPSSVFSKLQEIDLKNIHETNSGKIQNFVDLMDQVKMDLLEIRNAKKNERSPNISTIPKAILDLNPLEREKYLMRWQWDQLTDIDAGEVFTLKQLFVYKLKLQLLHRLNSFDATKGGEILETIVNPADKMEEK
jgi:hypothetical protein